MQAHSIIHGQCRTGSTGYIGGSVLHTLTTQHPEYEISVLLRNPTDDFRASYPKTKIVQGSYDDAEILKETASEANIVVHCGDSDHEGCVSALLAGLDQRSAPSFYIHLSGTMIVADWKDGQPGGLSHRVWSDLDDIDAFWSMPEDAMHRNTELIIQSYFEQHGDRLKTAVVCPPDLHGKGRGPGKKTSILLPALIESIQKQGVAFYLNSGTNTRSWVHIDDLMQIYLSLVEAAAAGGEGADWNHDVSGYAQVRCQALICWSSRAITLHRQKRLLRSPWLKLSEKSSRNTAG